MANVIARRIHGDSIELEPGALDGLRTRLLGAMFLPESPGYEESRHVWNGMVDRRPAFVVRCLGTADVVAAAAFARDHDLVLCMKGGGHNIAGLAVSDGVMMLDFAWMRGVHVDPVARVAHAQAGCLLADVDRATQLHGLAAVLGFVSNTGIAGLTLGGGFGYLSRRFGWTTDNVRSIELVTADGRLVRASRSEQADLFWGLCGGGGNFGVVTNIEFDLHPVGPEIVGGAIAWPAEQAPEVLERLRALAADSPPQLALVAAMRPAPPAPWIRADMHGRPIVASFVCWSGAVAEGEKLLAPLRSLGAPVGDIVQRRSYVSQQSLLDATQPRGRRYYWKSEYLPGLEPALLEAYRSHAARISSPFSAVLLFPLGGAIANRPADESAVGNRDARWVLNIAAAWEKPEEDASHRAWARAAWEDMRRFSTGGTYVNFLNEDDPEDRMQAAYGGNLRRLGAIKATWDPRNVFRANRNIRAT